LLAMPFKQKRILAAVGMLWVISASAQGVSVIKSTPLIFGSMAVTNGIGGSVTLSPTGARSASAGIYLLTSGPGAPAQFTVQSTQPNMAYSVTLPTSTMLLSDNKQMAVTSLTVAVAGSGTMFIPVTGGTQTLLVGGTLRVDSGRMTGNYAGNIPLTLTLNHP